MTISSEVSLVRYDGNASTTVFPYTFRVDDATHLIAVIADDATDTQTVLVKDTDYTLTGVGDDAGGNLTYPISGAPLPADWTITIYRVVPRTQTTNFTGYGSWHPEVLESILDHIMMAIQQLQEQIDRAYLVSVTSGTTPSSALINFWDGSKWYLDKDNYPNTYITSVSGDIVFYMDDPASPGSAKEVFRIETE